MDPNAGPLSELDRWKRRQRLLTSITEQLKGKECKAVIGVLITAKSRHLKKWKLVDSRYVNFTKRLDFNFGQGCCSHNLFFMKFEGVIEVVQFMYAVQNKLVT